MPKTYKCPECREPMEAKYKDQDDKTIWYCKNCDGFFSIEVPFRYVINEELLEDKTEPEKAQE